MSIDSLAPSVCMDRIGLSGMQLERWLGMLDGRGVSGDLFFQRAWHEELAMEQGRINGGRHTIGSGAGIRASLDVGGGSRFASSSSLATRDVDKACSVVAGSVDPETEEPPPFQTTRTREHQTEIEDRISMLYELNEYACKGDIEVSEVAMSLAGACEDILIADTSGLLVADHRPQTQFRCDVTVQYHGLVGRGGAGAGGRTTYAALHDAGGMHKALDAAKRMAVAQMLAKPTPQGRIPVIFAPGWNGMLLHETVGHFLEADSMQANTSAFAGKIGSRVASELVNVFDDGTLPGLWGTSRIDDEGQEAGRVCLVERGVLKAVLHNRKTALYDGVRPTGNARRQSYAHRPIPRMTNTYLGAGPHSPSEIVASVDHGIYARTLGRGQVHPVTGRFVFEVIEAYLIAHGTIGTPIKSFFVSGTAVDFLRGITMIGNDLEMDPGVGRCRKHGQTVTVGVGQPTIRIDDLDIAGAP
ncbi:metalloprotease TldD [Dyella monticola]|uniref:Metalloprotease TldD n=1 Tax=Dyella monticola TaxID=1927958 RepID=A0A370X2X3_9GAMM|nr:metallopeptidase TldD-related protein [Dyella monticola]RDS82763.1 metalloprotease TldD [Dyella monticola]